LNVGQSQQLFSQALREFQNNLAQQALANRASIGESFAQTALGLGRERMAQTTTTQKTSGGGGLGGSFISGGLGMIGALGGGLLGNPGLFGSSRKFKEDIDPLKSKEYKRILDKLDEMPNYRWKYKRLFGDPRRHIGPVTEESPIEIVTDDGKAIVIQDAIGFMMAAMKGLSKKIKELENA
jgi:hypothetical protein